MNIKDTNYHFSDVIQKLEHEKYKNTFNFARCFLDRDKISLYIKNILQKIKNTLPDVEVMEGFVHKKIDYKSGDRKRLNNYKGIIIRVGDKEKLLEMLREPERSFGINASIIDDVIEIDDCVMVVMR